MNIIRITFDSTLTLRDMNTTTHAPQANCTNRYIIEGSDIDELISECISKIRTQSKDFYARELRADLIIDGKSLIDSHAGMGFFYIVILK